MRGEVDIRAVARMSGEGWGYGALVARRGNPARLPSSPAKAGDPVTPVIPHRDRRDDWMPACAGTSHPSFRGALKARTRNPDTNSVPASGFRALGLKASPRNDARNNSQTILTLIHLMDYMPVIPPHRPWGHLQRLLMLGRGAVAGRGVGDAAPKTFRRSKPLLSRRASRAPRGSFDGISVPGIGQGYRGPTGQDPRNGR